MNREDFARKMAVAVGLNELHAARAIGRSDPYTSAHKAFEDTYALCMSQDRPMVTMGCRMIEHR